MKQPIVIQIVGFKNRGKTTLVCKLVERLKDKGFQVGTIKHDAHEFEMDKPGKDTWKHREAGAETVSIISSSMTAIIKQRPLSVYEILDQMNDLDFVFIEGFKNGPFPKIVLLKEEEDQTLLKELTNIIGVACWIPFKSNHAPVFSINDLDSALSVIKT